MIINITIKAIVYAMISIMANTVTDTTSCGTVDDAVSEIHQYSPISNCPSTQSLPTCTTFHNITPANIPLSLTIHQHSPYLHVPPSTTLNIPPAITIDIPLSLTVHQHSPYQYVPPSTTFLQLLRSIFPWGEDCERGMLVDHQS